MMFADSAQLLEISACLDLFAEFEVPFIDQLRGQKSKN